MRGGARRGCASSAAYVCRSLAHKAAADAARWLHGAAPTREHKSEPTRAITRQMVGVLIGVLTRGSVRAVPHRSRTAV